MQNPPIGRLRVSETPTPTRHLATARHRPSFPRDLMNADPRLTKTRRKESAIVRQLTGPTVGQATTQAWVNENGATVYYTAQYNGGGSLATIPFRSIGPDSRVTVPNQVVHSDSIRSIVGAMISQAIHFSTATNACLRYSDNFSFPLLNGCNDVPSALSTFTHKCKSATPRTNPVVVYRQGRSTIFRMPIYPMLNQCQ